MKKITRIYLVYCFIKIFSYFFFSFSQHPSHAPRTKQTYTHRTTDFYRNPKAFSIMLGPVIAEMNIHSMYTFLFFYFYFNSILKKLCVCVFENRRTETRKVNEITKAMHYIFFPRIYIFCVHVWKFHTVMLKNYHYVVYIFVLPFSESQDSPRP